MLGPLVLHQLSLGHLGPLGSQATPPREELPQCNDSVSPPRPHSAPAECSRVALCGAKLLAKGSDCRGVCAHQGTGWTGAWHRGSDMFATCSLCAPAPFWGHLLIESARPAQHTAACRPLVGKVPSPCRWPSGCLQRQPGCVREVLFPALLLAACCVCLTAGPMSTLTLPVVASCPYTLSTWGGLLFEKLFLAFSKK